MNSKEYQAKLQQFKAGLITEKEWRDYCFLVLCDKMESCKEIFIRLKDR